MAIYGAMRQGEENMTRNTLFGNVIMVVLAAITLSAATGCSESGGNSNPTGNNTEEMFPDAPRPYGGQTGVAQEGPGLLDRLKGAAGGAAASGAASKVAGGWMFWPTLICLVVGGILLGLRIWAPGAIAAAIGLVLATLQWGVGFGFKWYTAVVAVYVILWAVSMATRFPWDNYIVYLGSVAWLLLAALGQVAVGLPGLTWGVFQALLVFSVAPALWRQPAIGARWVIMGGLWLLLLITH